MTEANKKGSLTDSTASSCCTVSNTRNSSLLQEVLIPVSKADTAKILIYDFMFFIVQ